MPRSISPHLLLFYETGQLRGGKKKRERKVRPFCVILLVLLFVILHVGCGGLVSGTSGTVLAAPSVTTGPSDQTVNEGETATFSVVAAGAAPLNYQWSKNGAAVAGGISSSYTTPATTSSDEGAQFAVLISNKAGSAASNLAYLHVRRRPWITTQPANQTVTAGQSATFSVVAAGPAPLNYQWNKNGTAISGATSSSYTTPTTIFDNGAQFTVVISNAAGSVTSNAATLTVTASAVAPTITAQPVNQAVTVGQAATFSVVAAGTVPLSYQWQKNGGNITGATSSSYTTPATTTSDSGSIFAVLVSNSAGTATSSAATLTVNSAPVAPTINTQPANQTVTAGQTATFSVVASGTAPLSYQWQKNGGNISGATSSSYTTPSTTTSDSGSTFAVVVSNTAGTATSNVATLTVNAAPVAPTISTQPTNQTVTAGQTATFSVVASGTAPISYQWQKNAANIAGATSSSYSTPATTTSDNGSTFKVMVSNSMGSATSNAATLTVNPAPAPAIQVNPTSISFGNVLVGAKLSQSLIISNTGNATLSITQITVTGATFSTSGYTLPISISAGQQTTVSVAFQPTAATTVSGSISIVSNAPTSPTTIALSGTGVAATFLLGANPATLSFGNVTFGSTASLNTTLTNNGNSNVTISSVTTVGTGFSTSGVTSGTVLTPNQSATLSVAFAPTVAGSATGTVTVASNATNSPATITLSGSGVSSNATLPTCGKLNDTNVYLPPNYDTFALPARGQSYKDPVFGCKITRVTDAVASGWQSANHFYSLETPFNADDSYLFVINGFTGGSPTIVDLSGNTVVPTSNMPGFNSAVGLVWDLTNPKVFYYTNGQQLVKGTISGTAPNATVASTTLATFSQYSSVVIPDDIDLSSDGLHLWLADCYQNCTGNIFLVTLNASNGAATSASQSTVLSGITHHGMTMVPNNGVFIDGLLYNSNGSLWNGTGTPAGGTSAHVDFGLNASGNTVAASIWGQGTKNNGCPSNFGWSLLDLTTAAVPVCLNDGIQNVGNSSHVSMRDTQSKNWIAHSVDDSGSCPSSSFWCYNNPTGMSGWGLYTGEIIIWDGLGNTVRLAHHRRRSDETYWAQTRGAISRDGKYIVFDSNFNQSANGVNYTDVYIIGPLY